jgi:(p)ppGpp synthase/HD superfamily hydrolase
MEDSKTVAALLTALHFAAVKHRDQRRKDVEASPYINHPIEVAELLARVGGVTDTVTLQGAVLHDTLEDTETTPSELEAVFGPEVRRVVEEVTDDKSLPKPERKRLQIEHAPHLSRHARQIKLADKISNILGVTRTPPAGWSMERRLEYLDWTERVVAGCRGCNAALEEFYDHVLEEGRRSLDGGTI